MNDKNLTARIVVEDFEIKGLRDKLASRKLCPHLLDYLSKVIAIHEGGIRKINIPSSHQNVGVILLGSSRLEDTYLEMHDELHIFYDGKVIIIRWDIRDENGLCVPDEELSSLEIEKVSVKGKFVILTLSSPKIDFFLPINLDLYDGEKTIIDIPHPLNQRPAP